MAPPALARCVGDTDAFLARHWSKAPLHRPAPEGDAGAFTDLLSLDAVDHIVSSTLPRSPALRLVRDGKVLDADRWTRPTMLGGRLVTGVADPGRVWDEFAAGATVVLQGLHRWWLPLARFCRDLETGLTHPAQANAYVTPPTARGLAVHHDTHDVFVLQVAGSKQWAVHPPVVELPLRSQAWSAALGPPDDPVLEVELAPGDCLYVPRGFPHSARSQDGVSIHVTVGVMAWTGDDVVRELVRRVGDDIRFRQPLPVGFAGDEELLTGAVADTLAALRQWLDGVDPAETAGALTRRFWSSRPSVLAGHLQQLCRIDDVDDTATVARRPAAVCHLIPAGDALRLVLADRELRMPAVLEPAVRRLADGHPLKVGDLAAERLDEKSRHVLVRRLVREGLLEVRLADARPS